MIGFLYFNFLGKTVWVVIKSYLLNSFINAIATNTQFLYNISIDPFYLFSSFSLMLMKHIHTTGSLTNSLF